MAEEDLELGPVDIDHTVQLLLNYEDNSQNHSNCNRQTICMVPSVFRDLSPSSFNPRVVSIGPLHNQDEHLKGSEEKKVTCMKHLLGYSKDSTPGQTLKACVKKVSDSIDKIKACYVGMKKYPDSELAKMMVMDACFILDFIYNLPKGNAQFSGNMLIDQYIIYDMFLIENQIPFFVLEDIFACTILKFRPKTTLPKLIFKLVQPYMIFEGYSARGNAAISATHDHILGFLHKSYQLADNISSGLSSTIKGHSAAELDRSGVNFKENLNTNCPMAMELELSRFACIPLSWWKPTLKMPVLRIHDFTELIIIRNLIIYEHSAKVQTCVTSYMCAMDMLIDTPEDVARLVKSKVLVNELGSDEKAADFINDICKEVPVIAFFYQEQWKQLDMYYNSYGPKIIAGLKRRYFTNPWSMIALFAGIVLFILTVVQTVYGIKGA